MGRRTLPRRQQEALAVAEQRSAREIEIAVDRAALAKRIKAQLRRPLGRMSLVAEFGETFVVHWERKLGLK